MKTKGPTNEPEAKGDARGRDVYGRRRLRHEECRTQDAASELGVSSTPAVAAPTQSVPFAKLRAGIRGHFAAPRDEKG